MQGLSSTTSSPTVPQTTHDDPIKAARSNIKTHLIIHSVLLPINVGSAIWGVMGMVQADSKTKSVDKAGYLLAICAGLPLAAWDLYMFYKCYKAHQELKATIHSKVSQEHAPPARAESLLHIRA